MKRLIICIIFATVPLTASAEMYKVQLSRKAQDFYQVEGTYPTVYVKTRYCYAYAMYEDSIIDTDGGRVVFLQSNETCDIDKLLR